MSIHDTVLAWMGARLDGIAGSLARLGPWLAALGLLAVAAPPARAIIVQGGRDVNGNLDNSGRNLNPAPFSLGSYQGLLDTYFLGTPISSQYFLTAQHVAAAVGNTTTFVYNIGTATPTTYTAILVASQDDLAIYKVADGGPTFSLFAPLYTGSNEVGNPLVTLGRGYPRDGPITGPTGAPTQGQLVGWQPDPAFDLKVSWGTNTVGSIANQSNSPGILYGGDFLRFTFDRVVDGNGNLLNPDTGIFTGLDSSGGTFVRDPADGTYKLAGVNSQVDAVRTTPNGPVQLYALFDSRGFYDGPNLITGPDPVPLASYASRISTHLGFIEGVTGVPEPGGLALMAIGLIGGLGLVRARRRAAAA